MYLCLTPCCYGTHEKVSPKCRRVDHVCIGLRIAGILTVFSLGMAFVVHPQYSVYVEPLPTSDRTPDFYTYRLDFQCNSSYVIPETWLNGKIDTKVFNAGCGGYGDFVQRKAAPARNTAMAETSSGRQRGMIAFDVFWALLGLLFGLCVVCCYSDGKTDFEILTINKKQQPFANTFYLGCYALWISLGFLIHAAEFKSRQDTWICRPYEDEYDNFNLRSSWLVVTDYNRRESIQFTTAEQWNEVLMHKSQCQGMMLTEKLSDHHFEVRLAPSPQLAAYFDETRQRIWNNAVQLVFYTFLMFGLISPGLVSICIRFQRVTPSRRPTTIPVELPVELRVDIKDAKDAKNVMDAKDARDDKIQKLLCCPIMLERMVHPTIISPCGHTFEQSAINMVFAQNGKCPLCNQEIISLAVNYSIKDILNHVK